MSHSPPTKSQYYDNGRNSRNYQNGSNEPQQQHRYPPQQNGAENGRNYPMNGQETIPRSSYADRTYSLPRTTLQQQQPGYYTQDRRSRAHQNNATTKSSNGGTDTPDFYFMPSQRKYSGEVVRVYVDYNKDPKD